MMRAVIFVQLAVICLGFVAEQSSLLGRPYGDWAGLMQGVDWSENLPAQHFLCGYQFRARTWSRQFECNCRRRWIFRRRCSSCTETYDTMRSGFKAIFCHYRNWNSQITKSFQTRSPNAGGWKQPTMCPKDHYVNGYATNLGNQHGQDLGFVGLKIRCSTYSLGSTAERADNPGAPLTAMYVPRQGRFVSTVNIRHLNNDILAGIFVTFEEMAVISRVVLAYGEQASVTKETVVLETNRLENCSPNRFQKIVTPQKKYETSSSWSSPNSFFQGYSISPQVLVPPPASSRQVYQPQLPFSLDKPSKSQVSPSEQIAVLMEPNTGVTLTCALTVQRGSVPFRATVSFTGLATGRLLFERIWAGDWTGHVVVGVQTFMDEKRVCGNVRKFI